MENAKTKINFTTLDMVETALYAALIFLGIEFFRIPTGGTQFIHFGNALVATGVLVLGAYKGTFAAGISLLIFDLSHGYASSAPITVAESVIVCLILSFIFEKILSHKDKMLNIFFLSAIAAILKIIMNFAKYAFIKGMFVQGFPFHAALIYAVGKITGTFGSALLTFIAVPLLYPLFKKVIEQVRH